MNNTSNKRISQNRARSWIDKMNQSKFYFGLHPSQMRKARLALGKSQEDIASLNDLSHTTFGDVERGKRLVRKETAERISEQLNQKLTDIFVKEEKKFRAKVLK